MSVEGGGSIAVRAASVSGPRFNRGGLSTRIGVSSFEAAPSLGISSIVNEGPVRGFLEGFSPMNRTNITTIDRGGAIAPLGEIIFNPSPRIQPSRIQQDGEGLGAQIWEIPEPPSIDKPAAELINQETKVFSGELQAEQIATAAWNKVESPASVFPEAEWVILPDVVDQRTGTDLQELAQPDLNRRVDSHPQPELGRVTSTGEAPAAGIGAEAIHVPAAREQIVEEVAEESKLVADKANQQTREAQEEEVIQSKRAYLVDQPVLAQVLLEADQAVEKGEKEAERLGLSKKLLGYLIAKFIPGQHEGNTGGAVKPYGVDGAIAARKEAIAATNEFSSKKEVKAVILGNRPVTIGEEGERASKNEIRTTFRDLIVKPTKLMEIVEKRIKRIAGIRIETPVQPLAPWFEGERVVLKTENSLEDLDLEEVFQRAV